MVGLLKDLLVMVNVGKLRMVWEGKIGLLRKMGRVGNLMLGRMNEHSVDSWDSETER